ncbi:MAG: N-acetyltransferase family protein [Acidimicrobiales bacterium]
MVDTRLARLSDAEAIRAIYNHYVTTTTVTFDMVPRSLEQQEAWLSERSGALAVIVAVDVDDRVIGFASLSPYKPRPAYRTSVENSVYVDPGSARQGVGRALMARLIEVANDHGYHAMMARIADANPASVGLHEAVGFELVGIEKEVGRKFNRWLDVAVMQRLL